MVDRFLARASLGPVLEALGPEAAASCHRAPRSAALPELWRDLPSSATFAIAAEDLAAGGRFFSARAA